MGKILFWEGHIFARIHMAKLVVDSACVLSSVATFQSACTSSFWFWFKPKWKYVYSELWGQPFILLLLQASFSQSLDYSVVQGDIGWPLVPLVSLVLLLNVLFFLVFWELPSETPKLECPSQDWGSYFLQWDTLHSFQRYKMCAHPYFSTDLSHESLSDNELISNHRC